MNFDFRRLIVDSIEFKGTETSSDHDMVIHFK